MKIHEKKILVSVLFLVMGIFAFCTGNAFAEGEKIKIGVLDLQKVLYMSDLGKAAKVEIEQKYKELEKKFKKDEEALAALQDEIEKKSSVWSDEKKQDKAIEFQKMRRDLRVKQDDANLELKQLQEKQFAPILKELDGVVTKYAKDNSLTVILPKEAVLYAVDGVEITEEVTKALNEASKKE